MSSWQNAPLPQVSLLGLHVVPTSQRPAGLTITELSSGWASGLEPASALGSTAPITVVRLAQKSNDCRMSWLNVPSWFRSTFTPWSDSKVRNFTTVPLTWYG